MTIFNGKILYIGTTKENSKHGEISRADLRALSKSFDVVSRPIIYSGGQNEESIKDLTELESKSLDGITDIIQYCLPNQWQRYGTMNHIGYLELSTLDLNKSKWLDYFNMVDEIWTPNESSIRKIQKVFSGPVKYLPHAVDLSIYKNNYPFINVKEISGTFKFFCASDVSERSNLKGLLTAFWSAFDPTEPVSLILYSSPNVTEVIEQTKREIKLYNNNLYQKIVLIDQVLSQENMLGLYQGCDCYINPSLDESWDISLIHAVGFNKTIVSKFDNLPYDIASKYQKFHSYEDILQEDIQDSMRWVYRMGDMQKNEVYDFNEFSNERFIKDVGNNFV